MWRYTADLLCFTDRLSRSFQFSGHPFCQIELLKLLIVRRRQLCWSCKGAWLLLLQHIGMYWPTNCRRLLTLCLYVYVIILTHTHLAVGN